eukprot:4250244-Prymnesium_polylepis.1
MAGAPFLPVRDALACTSTPMDVATPPVGAAGLESPTRPARVARASNLDLRSAPLDAHTLTGLDALARVLHECRKRRLLP